MSDSRVSYDKWHRPMSGYFAAENPINTSKSKQMYSFSKSPRKNPARKTYCAAYYNLGSSVVATALDRKRTPSFGVGARMTKGPAAREAE